MLGGEHSHLLQVLQVAVAVLGVMGTLLAVILSYILKCLHEVRADIKHAHDQFEAFVRAENCKMHREVIEKHIAESEARIERMLSHCKHHKEEM